MKRPSATSQVAEAERRSEPARADANEFASVDVELAARLTAWLAADRRKGIGRVMAMRAALMRDAEENPQATTDEALGWIKRENYYRALAVYTELAATDHARSELGIAVCHNEIADIFAARGGISGALDNYRISLAIAEKLATREPYHAGWQRDLGNLHQTIGDMLAAGGDRDGALDNYRISLAIAEKLAALNPEDADWQRDLWRDVERIGDALTACGEGEDALAAYGIGLAIAEKLAALDPRNAVRQRNVLASRAKVDDATLAAGRGAARQSSDLVSEPSVQDRPVPGETTTPAQARGKPGLRHRPPLPEKVGHGVTRPAATAGDLNAVAEELGVPFEEGELVLRRFAEAKSQATGKITREVLDSSVPPSLLSDGRQKYDFEPELFDDAALAKREESIANKVKYKVRQQQPVTATERRRANVSKAFLAQLKNRPTNG